MARENPLQDKVSFTNYFGFSDADDEKDFEALFLKTPEFEDLKYGQRTEGSFVVTGSKGSGKTAIRRYLATASSNSLTWQVDLHNRFLNVHAKDLGKYPAEVESVVLNLVLGELTRKVVNTPDAFPSKGVELAKELLPTIAATFMKRIAGATKVKAGNVELDLSKVLDSDKSRFTQFDYKRYVQPLTGCFSKQPALVLFDDVDDVFLGADRPDYPAFVEGLIRAAKTINLTFGKSVHFLVFLKYGIFRSFYERPRDYDKVKQYIVTLKWTDDELGQILARRITDRQQLRPTDDVNSALAKVFKPSSVDSQNAIRVFLFERCSSGPRDVIEYCNQAVDRAKKPEITLGLLKDCETQFSKDKLIQVYQDYGYTYPDIHILIGLCFQDCRVSYKSDDFREFVLTKVLGDKKIADLFGKYAYFDAAKVDNIIQILYTTGFIGYVSGRDNSPTYVLSDPRGDGLFDGETYIIHPAFRRGLRVRG